MKRMVRCVGVIIAICSWIAVSNHCAFAAVSTEINNRDSGCPFHSKAAKQKEHSPQVECCRILRALVSAKGKTWARDDALFRPVNFPIPTGALVVSHPRVITALLLDTGPPGALCFAELILQHSLLIHAPPFVA